MNYSLILVRNFSVNLQYYHGNLLYVSVPRWQQSFFKMLLMKMSGQKRCFRNLKLTNEHIKKDSIRYFVEKLWKLRNEALNFSVCEVLNNIIDKCNIDLAGLKAKLSLINS